MTVFLGFMVAITLVLWLAPDSPAGRALHENLVERPLSALANFKRHHLIYVVVLAGLVLSGGEMLALLGPEFVAAFALDLSIYLDAVLVTYALSTLAAARKGGGWLKYAVMQKVRKVRPRGKRPARRVRPERKPSNDDDPAPALLAA